MTRRRYLGVLAGTVAMGLLSRELSFLPLFLGDMFYAAFVLIGLRCCFPSLSLTHLTFASLLICFGVECSQLIQAPWLVELRATTSGGLILGHGFLWSDLLAYTAAILGVYAGIRHVEKDTHKSE